MKAPSTAQWGLRISAADLEKLKAGLRPKDQDDKWHYYASTSVSAAEQTITVHIARSAFGYDCYILHIVMKPDSNGSSGSSAEIASITWETSIVGSSEEQAKKEVVGITRSVLACNFDAAPEYD